jgi:hypothetical protein
MGQKDTRHSGIVAAGVVGGRRRQAALNAADARAGNTWRPLVVDGVCGPASVQAMRRHGNEHWRNVGCAERAA